MWGRGGWVESRLDSSLRFSSGLGVIECKVSLERKYVLPLPVEEDQQVPVTEGAFVLSLSVVLRLDVLPRSPGSDSEVERPPRQGAGRACRQSGLPVSPVTRPSFRCSGPSRGTRRWSRHRGRATGGVASSPAARTGPGGDSRTPWLTPRPLPDPMAGVGAAPLRGWWPEVPGRK